jgi:hypothetical protein
MTGLRVDEIAVRGNATDEELAAVLAALAERQAREPSGYERWRSGRLAALRRSGEHGQGARL